MAYGIRYTSQFDSVADANTPSKRYTVNVKVKNYTGGVTSISGAETTFIQSCTTDDPVAPIKGQSASLTFLNISNTLPITAFQSEADDDIMVELLDDNLNTIWVGFMVQDDFYEPMVDYPHAIQLSANDSLGLLKGVILSDARIRRYFEVYLRTNGINTVVYCSISDTAFYPIAGDIFEILGVPYTITTAVNETTVISSVVYSWTLTLATSTGGISPADYDTYLTGPINLRQRNSLLTMIAVCLAQTNLSLITNIFHNLYEYRQDQDISTFEQTLIDSQLFISGETYEDCYSVLTKILQTFNCTLFQANGQWNIVNWHEARQYTDNAIPGFVYDENWTAVGRTTFTNNFFIGPDPQLTRPTFQLTQGALRGYKFVRKSFNYRQPKYLLQNWDLQTLGPLIRTYVSGLNTISEYIATGWTLALGPIVSERFIRVIRTTVGGSEVDRYLVIRGNTSNTILDTASDFIEANVLDKIIVSFSTRTNFSQGPTYGAVFGIRLYDGSQTRYVDDLPAGNGAWIPTVGYNQTLSPNTNQWQNVEIASSQIPFNGQITVFLAQNNAGALNSSRETHYKDIRFEYIPYINDGTKITGQIHKQEQDVNKKLNSDTEITIDDSPRNNIVGTLFLTTKTPNTVYGLQDRTLNWRYPNYSIYYKLGQITALDELRWRQQTRSKLEGGFIGNYQQSIISLLTVGITTFNTTKIYSPGLLTIDYKNNQFSGTWWEMNDRTQPELSNTYLFTYIYSSQ